MNTYNHAIRLTVALLLTVLLTQAQAADYRAAADKLGEAVREQIALYTIRGVAVALVDDQQIVHEAGYGTAQADSVFRAGSISKLLNAVAVMQLVEQGKLDLDRPIEKHGEEFRLVNPFPNTGSVTLRQLLCHRSGIIRESPVGGYLDGSEPGLERTVASVGQCPLVNPPNFKTRYSNVGPTVAGVIVSRVSGLPYARYQLENVLRPMGMTNSAFLLKDVPRGRLLTSYMRVAEEGGGFKIIPAPQFDLGTYPAGNLFTTAGDLARFISVLLAEGRAGEQRVLSAATLAQMFTPQLTTNATGFGLGFSVGKFRERKTIGHMGMVYGFTSSLIFVPEAKIGVVILSNEDIASGPVRKLANLALGLMLEAKLGEAMPPAPAPITLAPDAMTAMCGEYESPNFWARVEIKDGRLAACISGQEIALTPVEPLRCLMNSRVDDNAPLVFEHDGAGKITAFTARSQRFARVEPGAATNIPVAWRAYLGSYGPAFIPVVISIRHGHLYAMTENMDDYRLTPVNYQVFAMPAGLYTDEHLVFLADGPGKPRAINLANMILKRR